MVIQRRHVMSLFLGLLLSSECSPASNSEICEAWSMNQMKDSSGILGPCAARLPRLSLKFMGVPSKNVTPHQIRPCWGAIKPHQPYELSPYRRFAYVHIVPRQEIEYNPAQRQWFIFVCNLFWSKAGHILHTIWMKSKLSVAVDHWVEGKICRKPCGSFFCGTVLQMSRRAISETPGSRKGHQKIQEGPSLTRCFHKKDVQQVWRVSLQWK